MITPEELLERLNPWIAMPVGLVGDQGQTLTRLKRLNEVLEEMQREQLVDRGRAWKAVLGIGDIRRMRDAVGQFLDEIEEAHSEALHVALSEGGGS